MARINRLFSITSETNNNSTLYSVNILGIKLRKRIKSKYEKLQKKKYKKALTTDEIKYVLEQWGLDNMGYRPNLDNPRTFNEKLNWLKLHDRNPLLPRCADKYMVREYIRNKIGDEHLIPLLGVYNKVEDIDFASLPDAFVLKVNWGSGQNIIVTDKSKLDIEDAKEKLRNWLLPESNQYYHGFEWAYKNISPKIIAEKYIQQRGKPLQDYKWFVFNGQPQILSITLDSYDYSKMTINYYDKNFNLLPYTNGYPNSDKIKERPANWNKMLEIINTIGRDFTFVRIDFYDTGEQVYVGELTFYPGSGIDKFAPVEWDQKLGDMLQLGTN